MTTQQVADKFVEYCRTNQSDKAHEELYHSDVESFEMPNMPNPHVKGIAAIRTKNKDFDASVEAMHSAEVSEPTVVGNHFSVAMRYDMTMKERGRINMEEIAVYEVKDSKIVTERYFY